MFELTKISPQPLQLSPIAGLLRGLMPDPLMTVSQWADQRRYLPQESAEPGKFKMSRTPYMQEIADTLSVFHPAQLVVFKKPSQIAGTENGNNWVGYIIDVAPTSMLYVMPTDMLMKDTSKNRIDKMIESTPSVRAKIKPARAKDSKNTILFKEFEGGFLKCVGANSPVGLASTAIRYVYMDEIDRYPMSVGGEGSAVSLAKTRTITYGARRKMFLTSTPTLKGTSAIDDAYAKTDQRQYHVPCPHCGTLFVMAFDNLRYDKQNIKSAGFEVKYECDHCHELIEERYKTKMLEAGKWISSHPENSNGLEFGYHLNAMYSPYGWYSWADMVKDYEDAQNDIPKLITFTNTKLGEVYDSKGDKPDWEMLYAKRERYPKNQPFEEVALLTAGVDVQADRIELEIVGWIKGKRSQSIDYRILFGDTTQDDVWKQLDAVLNETFTRADGATLTISKMAVDTGYNTSHVYAFCRRHHVSRVIPVKGQDKQIIMVSNPKVVDKNEKGKSVGHVKVFNIGVSIIKSELYGWLKINQPADGAAYADGYCHFPEYDEVHFRSLTAEELQQTTNKKGEVQYSWVVKYKRNERLDCRVYARAAAAVCGIDRYTEKYWQELQQSAQKPVQNQNNTQKKKRNSDYWK